MPTTWIDEYRRLLVTEASEGALEATLSLMEKVAGLEVKVPSVKAVSDRLDHEDARDEQIRRHLSESLRAYLATSLDDAHLTRRRKRDLLRLQERCYRTVGALNIPAFLRTQNAAMTGARASLLLDTGLLVFHHAYFSLLRELGPGWKKEREFLLHAFLVFSASLPGDADRHRVQGLVHDALGDWVLAAFHYRQALQAGNPKDHEFMTLLHAAWSHSIEHGRFDAAMMLVLDNVERVSDEDFLELQDLLLETAALRRAA